MKILVSLSIFLSLFTLLPAQEQKYFRDPDHPFYFGLESGIKTFFPISREYDFIRKEATYYYGYYLDYSPQSLLCYTPGFSLIMEYRAIKDRLWISSGLGYSALYSSIKMGNSASREDDFFYVLTHQDDQEIRYYRIHSLQQWDHYLDVPIDFRFSPFLPRFFRLYFKAGLDLHFRLSGQQELHFHDPAMAVHEKEVMDLFSQQGDNYMSSHLGAGVQLGRQNKPNVRIEADLPIIISTRAGFSLLATETGAGFNMLFILPIKRL